MDRTGLFGIEKRKTHPVMEDERAFVMHFKESIAYICSLARCHSEGMSSLEEAIKPPKPEELNRERVTIESTLWHMLQIVTAIIEKVDSLENNLE